MKTQEKKAEKVAQAKQSEVLPLRQAPAGEVLQAYREGQLHRSAAIPVMSFAGNSAANHTGMPDQLKSGMERLSGYNLDGVRVHYNSDKPAQLQSLAYTQGTDIHIAPGQEQHLPHETWHVVQQMQGRVSPTCQLKGISINDNSGLEQEADRYGRLAVAGETMTEAVSIAPAQLRSAGGRPVAQMFRLVQPDAYHNDNGNVNLFSTHFVTHGEGNLSPRGSVRISSNVNKVMAINNRRILFFQSLSDLVASGLATINNYATYNGFISSLESLFNRSVDTTEELRSIYVDLIPDLFELKYRSFAYDHTTIHAVLHNMGVAAKNILNDLYAEYFSVSGRIADPQRHGKQMGEEEYVVEKISGKDRKMGEASGKGKNKLSRVPSIVVNTIQSNAHFPMLVSETTKFAINAAFPEPKEVYMTRDAMREANDILYNEGEGRYSHLYSENASVKINDVMLYKYKPHFVGASDSMESASTNACDGMVRTYYPGGVAGNLAVGNLKTEPDSRVPWPTHHAGKLCEDGSDTLSLENGARFGWLLERGGIINIGRTDLQRFSQELNKTWYFRIYGSQDLGQDIRSQTLARFNPIGQ